MKKMSNSFVKWLFKYSSTEIKLNKRLSHNISVTESLKNYNKHCADWLYKNRHGQKKGKVINKTQFFTPNKTRFFTPNINPSFNVRKKYK